MKTHLLYDYRVNKNDYYDKRSKLTREEYGTKLKQSTTLYMGNLSPFTSEEKLYNIFSGVGHVKNVILGLHKKSFKPCGFAFVEFYDRESIERALECF